MVGMVVRTSSTSSYSGSLPSRQGQQSSVSNYMPLSDYPDLQVTFSSTEIQEIRRSWNAMKDDPTAQEKATVHGTASAFFCQQFYENLLGEYPELKVLFPSIKSQSSSMAGILSLVISQLENLSRVNEILSSLGKRHSRIIGVDVGHFELVGNALLKTLNDRLEDDFSIELENAWIKLYSYIANVMLQSGEDPPLPPQSLYPAALTPTSSAASDSSRQSQSTKSQTTRSVTAIPPAVPAKSSASNVKAAVPTNDPASGGYNPSKSYFKSKNKPKKSKKNQDCVVM
ncbi:hypothetical protein TRVA0_097S00166 [Trichomonascus vanleenenianus]|uniref:uncharacterized protein n=1 Tax=Trichomonascus vanleenenianus TaxID=2268995 RepID=UPI003ECA78C0